VRARGRVRVGVGLCQPLVQALASAFPGGVGACICGRHVMKVGRERGQRKDKLTLTIAFVTSPVSTLPLP